MLASVKEKEGLVKQLASEGRKIAVIARLVGLSRKSVYKVLDAAGSAKKWGLQPAPLLRN
jgi:DNA-binding phage protein